MANSKGFPYAYGWNLYYQKLFGFWTIAGEGRIERLKVWLWFFIIGFFIWVPQLASLPILWGDLNEVITCISHNMCYCVAMAKILVLQSQRRVIGSILATIVDDWEKIKTKNEFQIMLETARISRFISIVSFSVTNLMLLIYISAQFWPKTKNDKNTTMDPRLADGLLYIAYYPFNMTNRFIFVTIWLGQMFATLLGPNSYAGPDCLVSTIVLHLCGQLRIVSDSLKNIVDHGTIREPEQFWQKLTAAVNRHTQLIHLTYVLGDAFSSILLVQMLICSLTFCFQGYTMFTALLDRNGTTIPVSDVVITTMYGIFSVVHLFFYCYVGDRLMTESTSISENFYEAEWYNLAPKEAKTLLFVCNRSQYPLEIKAGKFCTFNRQLFTAVLKTSMGYLSMLIAMKERLID